MSAPSLVWFRLDLRLADNPALNAAWLRGGSIIPVYIWAPEEEGEWLPGAASKWWLHQSLKALGTQLQALGSRLIIRRGPTLSTLRELIRETGAEAVYWNRRYEPLIVARDVQIKGALRSDGLVVESFGASLLHEPPGVQNQAGRPFQVFTPFWKHCLSQPDPQAPETKPKEWMPVKTWPKTLALSSLGLEPRIPWATGMKQAWEPGELGGSGNLHRFVRDAFSRYGEDRNIPGLRSTSRLSPHLHFGEVSPRQVWHAIAQFAESTNVSRDRWRRSSFITELGWREFAYHLLYHFSQTTDEPLRQKFATFPWQEDPEGLRSWQRGRTGFPIVDAGLRELWATGWMHNRVRMIVASFLVKDLLISWKQGARWFWDTLVDADLASNTLGWQWVAGCGADAAPYYRIFNPVIQGQKFDPDGTYVREWCPELAGLPSQWIHAPQLAPPEILLQAGVRLGKDYPKPIVDHAAARLRAQKVFAGM